MKSIAVLAPGAVGIVDVPMPEAGPYEALVRNEIAFICNATDRKVVAGRFPGIGADRYPLLLGHESAGTVVAVGAKVRSFAVGDRVIGGLLPNGADGFGSAWGGDSEYVLAMDHEAMAADGAADEAHGWIEVSRIMRSVPADISYEAAGLLCTWREVYAAFSDFRLRPGDDVLIFGAGPVGLSFCKFARLLGLGWIGVVDPIPWKRERALRAGADAVFAPEEASGCLGLRKGKPLDTVIDAVGNERIINAALPLIRLDGSVCVYGVVAGDSIRVEKGRGPYNFNLLVHQWPTREAEAAAQEPLIAWLREGKLSAEEFKTGEFPFAEIGADFAQDHAPFRGRSMMRYARRDGPNSPRGAQA